jgi:two-component sensor histidine kinase
VLAQVLTQRLPQRARDHLTNVGDNLQLLADLGYCDAALAVPDAHGELVAVAAARPRTAADPVPSRRINDRLPRADEPEAYDALLARRPVLGAGRRLPGGVTGSSDAYPLGTGSPYAVLLRTYGEQVETTASRMETAFIDAARDLMQTLRDGPLLDAHTGRPFSTERRPGDGVLRVSPGGAVAYASPNAVSIMREAGVEGRVTGMRAAELPGGALGIAPMLGAAGGLATELDLGGRTLGYRCIALTSGALVLVEDLTESRRRERELGVKETTIREVHHRVKNNLQTIASLLRMQARRSGSEEVRRALGEAVERTGSMATVHDLLARSADECVDFAEVARRVVGLVHSGVMGDDQRIAVRVAGETGPIGAGPATSLALVLTELVHNSLEHAFNPGDHGTVCVDLTRDRDGLLVVVHDDGRGLPKDFDPATANGLGLSIVRTLVEQDLGGELSLAGGTGAGFTIGVPLSTCGEST